jgi:alpha-tubulin suppressor-like RCC1 family protein
VATVQHGLDERRVNRNRARLRRVVGAVIAAAALAGTALFVDQAAAALPAGSGPAGAATMIPSTGTTSFRIQLPGGAACPGDSASGGYRWQTFLAASSVDVSQLTYLGGVPSAPGGAQVDLLYTSGNPIVDQNTALTTGAIVGLPNSFEFTVFPANYLAAGTYSLGVACTLGTTVEKYWSASIDLTLDGAGLVNGFSPFVAAVAPTAPTVVTPLTRGVSGSVSGSITAVSAVPAVDFYTVTATPAVGPAVSVQVVPPATAFNLSGLSNRVSYTVSATATNAAGTSPASAGVAAIPYVANPAPVQLAAGAAHSCALLSGGTVRCWGLNSSGQLGNGTAVSSSTPVVATGLTAVTHLAAGDKFSCAVTAARVKCWGLNTNGQLGNGSLVGKTVPTQVMATPTAALSGVSRVAAGTAFACALNSPGVNGTVRCWGANNTGQLGDGTVLQRPRPVVVKATATTGLKGVTAIAAGGSSACALLTNGAVRCWGLNTSGQLGNNTLVSSKFPVQVAGINGVAAKATAITVGANFACARISNGTVRCWGNNASGQLGNNTVAASKVPVVVKTSATAGLTGATTVVAGAAHVCVVRGAAAAARVLCWGNNANGQLGVGNLVNRRVATVLASPTLNGVKSLALGGAHTLAVVPSSVRTPSDAAGWGRNANGQLGVVGTPKLTPVIVSTL